MKNVALIVAAGNSSRVGFDKLFDTRFGIPVIEQALSVFESSEVIDEIYVITKEADQKEAQLLLKKFPKVKCLVEGGNTRFESVKNGLLFLDEKLDENVSVIVHNGANPNLSLEDLEAGITKAEKYKNVIFGFFSPNSIKQVNESGKVVGFLNRDEIFETQTPQISELGTFVKALEVYASRGQTHGSVPTEPKDEAELLSVLEEKIYVYECDTKNQKITFASDFKNWNENIKIGFGEDAHRFAKNFDPEKPFRLGNIDMSEGSLSSDGNSDGDLILHSLCNAILSAIGEKTFDEFATPMCKSGLTNSKYYLQKTLEILSEKFPELKLQQIIISLEGLRPKIQPNHEKIIKSLSELTGLVSENIGLTYTTGEGLNSYGKGEGMRSWCFVVLTSS